MDQPTVYYCEFCGLPVPSGRSDKQYDCNSCKQKAYRWRKRMERYAHDLAKAQADLASYLKYPKMRDRAKEELELSIQNAKNIARSYGVKLMVINK